MAGFIELATLKAPVVADAKGFKVGMSIVKKEGKDAANEIEKDFQNASKKAAISWENASNKIQKSLKTTEKDAKELTKSAENIYKDGFGKSAPKYINPEPRHYFGVLLLLDHLFGILHQEYKI